jgi:hypothetical protein
MYCGHAATHSVMRGFNPYGYGQHVMLVRFSLMQVVTGHDEGNE